MRRVILCWIVSCLLSVLPLAASQVVLLDGRVLSGDVERRGENYRVAMDGGGVVTLPVDLVAEIRLGAEPGEEPPEEEAAATPAPQTPVRVAPSRPTPTPPSVQLGSFERLPDWPRPPLITARWVPEDSLGHETDVTGFSPSIWPRTDHDPSWAPASAYGPETGAVMLESSSFPSSPVDPRWWPTDAWAGIEP